MLAIDLCDLEWGAVRKDQGAHGWVDDDWALVTEFSLPSPDRYVRQMATFIRDDDGSWHRDDERHDNILIDTSRVPALLAEHGVGGDRSDVVRRGGLARGSPRDRRSASRLTRVQEPATAEELAASGVGRNCLPGPGRPLGQTCQPFLPSAFARYIA